MKKSNFNKISTQNPYMASFDVKDYLIDALSEALIKRLKSEKSAEIPGIFIGGAILAFMMLMFLSILWSGEDAISMNIMPLIIFMGLSGIVLGLIIASFSKIRILSLLLQAIKDNNVELIHRYVGSSLVSSMSRVALRLYVTVLEDDYVSVKGMMNDRNFLRKLRKFSKKVDFSIEGMVINYIKMEDAMNYEKAKNYEMAAKLYEELGMYVDAGRCRDLMAGNMRMQELDKVRGMSGVVMAKAAVSERINEEQVRDVYGIEKGSARHSWGDFSTYKIEGKIGSGGFSEVYLVEREGKKYAMKIPKGVDMKGGETLELSKEDVGQYGKEAEIWAMLTERVPKGVVNLIDAGVQPFPWFVMELAEGSLRGLKEGMNYEDKLRLAIDLLSKLDKIHHFGVVHKDIKPENILYAGGEWKFTDFGLSKIISRSSKSSQMVSGTLMYMAPEQISKKKFGHTDWRTDIWQMGVMFYELLTGHFPFEAEDAGELAMSVIMEEPVPATEYGVSEGVWRVLEKALRKDKEQRWQSAAEMKRELEGLR